MLSTGAAFPLWDIRLGSLSSEFRVLSAGHWVPSLCPSSGRLLPSAEHMVPSAGHKVPIPWFNFPSSEHRIPTHTPTPGLISLLLDTGPSCRTQSLNLPSAKHMVPSAGHRVPHPWTQLQSDTGCLLSGRRLPSAGHRSPL